MQMYEFIIAIYQQMYSDPHYFHINTENVECQLIYTYIGVLFIHSKFRAVRDVFFLEMHI